MARPSMKHGPTGFFESKGRREGQREPGKVIRADGKTERVVLRPEPNWVDLGLDAPGDLHKGHPYLRQRIVERPFIDAESSVQAVNQCPHGIYGQASVVQVRGSDLQMHRSQLEQPDGVVRHNGRRRDGQNFTLRFSEFVLEFVHVFGRKRDRWCGWCGWCGGRLGIGGAAHGALAIRGPKGTHSSV